MSDRIGDLDHKLDAILEQVTRTNGRVTAVEARNVVVDEVLFGDTRRGTPGLVTDVLRAAEVVRTVETAVKVGRWLAVTFGAAAIGLAANLTQLWVT